MTKVCEICGRNTPALRGRWYVHDNGQQVMSQVCATCADVHAVLTGGK